MKTVRGLGGFHRQSLVEQATQALRTALLSRALPDPLPGEVDLAQQLGISRPTVRAALRCLGQEGWLIIAQGRRTRMAQRPAGGKVAPTVCVVCPEARSSSTLAEHPILLQVRALLATKGVGWEEILDAKLATPQPARQFARLTSDRRNVCWMLVRATPQMQQWFAQEKLPALVMGSCAAGVELASVDLDFRAVGWHAAGRLSALGHRHIGLVLPERMLAGDNACRQGVLEYVAQRSGTVTVTDIVAGASPAELRRRLDRLFRRNSHPSSLFCMHSEHTLTTYMHLLQMGRSVPQQVSLISRDSRALLDASLPELSRYSTPTRTVAVRAARLVEQLLASPRTTLKPHLVIPRFMAGRTLSPPPADPRRPS